MSKRIPGGEEPSRSWGLFLIGLGIVLFALGTYMRMVV